MATYTWNEDQNQGQPWVINKSNSTWIVGEDADFKVDVGEAIHELSARSNNTFRIFGDIETRNIYNAIGSQGAGAKVLIGETSRIETEGGAGVDVSGLDASVVSHGVIKGDGIGIRAGDTATLENHGRIRAEIGIAAFDVDSKIDNYGDIGAKHTGIVADGDGCRVTNHADGKIVAKGIGVSFDFNEVPADQVDAYKVLLNRGLIDAKTAIVDDEGELKIVNRGTINGNIVLGDGNDKLDSRNGEIDGIVLGGKGDDTYLLSDSSVKILEGLGGGYDTVKSTVDFTLSTGIDALYLLGSENIDGHGSRSSNTIVGNDGNNHLFGHDGNDSISGKAGRDILTGGDGDDTFTFGVGFGRDTIADYHDGEDRIYLGIKTNFESLEHNLKQHGDDVWITFGKDDRLVIEDTKLSQLSQDDFILV
jgi:Ca2+-binding RTX toxin-like protein